MRSYIISELKEDFLTVDQLIEKLQGDQENRLQINAHHKNRIAKILQKLGWERRRNSVKDEAGKRPGFYKPGANAKVLPKLKGSEEEIKATESFLIDSPGTGKPPLSNEHLRKLREQGPQLRLELIKMAEVPLEKLSELPVDELEVNLDSMLIKLKKLGINKDDCWISIERATGDWKAAYLRKESYLTAYRALAEMLARKLAVQHS